MRKMEDKRLKKQLDFSSKPYYRCFSCPHLRVRCTGPRTAGLPLFQWKELMRDMKDFFNLTYEWIALESKIPVQTVERALSLSSTQDIMRDTATKIENAIVGSNGDSPCFLAFEEEQLSRQGNFNDAMLKLERALSDDDKYDKMLDGIHKSYREEIDAIRADYQKMNDLLTQQLLQLHSDNNNLWAENNRKSKIIDMFLEKHSIQFVANKE